MLPALIHHPSMSPILSHGDLVQIAARWLRNTVGCSVVLTEVHSTLSETPDAIGWKIGQHWSWLVECKTSRADYRADRKKPSRQHQGLLGIGQERYYLAAQGLLLPEEMPDDWGLLEWTGKRVQVAKKHPRAPAKGNVIDHRIVDEAIMARELPLVLSALRRHFCSTCFAGIGGDETDGISEATTTWPRSLASSPSRRLTQGENHPDGRLTWSPTPTTSGSARTTNRSTAACVPIARARRAPSAIRFASTLVASTTTWTGILQSVKRRARLPSVATETNGMATDKLQGEGIGRGKQASDRQRARGCDGGSSGDHQTVIFT